MIAESTPSRQRVASSRWSMPSKPSKYSIFLRQLGSSAVGIKVDEGVVLAVERRLNSTLIVPSSIEKIFEVDWHIAVAASGVITDAKTLIEHARVEALNHRFTYLEPITVKALTQSVSDLALNFGEGDPSSKKKPMSRPYGVALLIAGVDERGPSIYQTDPSGTMIEYQAKGIGAADEGIQDILNRQYNAVSLHNNVEDESIRRRKVGPELLEAGDGGEDQQE